MFIEDSPKFSQICTRLLFKTCWVFMCLSDHIRILQDSIKAFKNSPTLKKLGRLVSKFKALQKFFMTLLDLLDTLKYYSKIHWDFLRLLQTLPSLLITWFKVCKALRLFHTYARVCKIFHTYGSNFCILGQDSVRLFLTCELTWNSRSLFQTC